MELDQEDIIDQALVEWFNAIVAGAVPRASGRNGGSGTPETTSDNEYYVTLTCEGGRVWNGGVG